MRILLSFNYWLNLRPGELSAPGLRYFSAFLVIIFAAAFIFWLLKKRRKGPYNRIWRKLHSFSVSNLIIGLFVLFFFFEAVPFLSARFWLLVWGLGLAVWLFFIGRAMTHIPEMREERQKEEEYRKYIP